MNCPSCGKHIGEDGLFCKYCGWLRTYNPRDDEGSKEYEHEAQSHEPEDNPQYLERSYKKRFAVGMACRIIFWITLAIIVLHSAVFSFMVGEYILMLLKLGFFPVTYFLWPWVSGLWWLWLISMASYIISATYGRIEAPD